MACFVVFNCDEVQSHIMNAGIEGMEQHFPEDDVSTDSGDDGSFSSDDEHDFVGREDKITKEIEAQNEEEKF